MSRVDTHHHVVPSEYAAWLRRKGMAAGGLPIPDWSPEAALALMDERDVGTAILSVSTPGAHLGDDAEARAMARDVNEFAAAMVRSHPARFGFFATLCLPDLRGSLIELEHAFDALGADGVVLLANSRGIYLGDKSFDPLFEELNRRKSVVFVHPSLVPGLEPLPDVPAFVVDFLLDTTRAAILLSRSGTLDRYPDLKIILAHAGGIVPYAAYRISAPRRRAGTRSTASHGSSASTSTPRCPEVRLRCRACWPSRSRVTCSSGATSRMRRLRSSVPSRQCTKRSR
jgi:predicted TIM-barrel fold metal-dependent hydrolase